MQKLFIVMLLSLTGCSGVRFCTQVCVDVKLINNCADKLTVEDAIKEMAGLLHGESETVTLVSRPFSGSYRGMVLTVKAWTKTGLYLGSSTETFSVSVHQGSYQDSWTVDNLQSPQNGGCNKR